MRRKNRNFKSRYYNHLFNISDDKGVIFYCIKDYLVFLSLISHYSAIYNIGIITMCIMVNHFHVFTKPSSSEAISSFMQRVTSHFSRLYNSRYGRVGRLFNYSYGYSQKFGEKSIRTTILYVLNNPVEKRLVKKAEGYRWNFLAYANSDSPFSEKITIRKSSKQFQNAIKSFDSFKRTNGWLTYSFLDILFNKLSQKEKMQLIDYIVRSYMCIDYTACLSFFDSDYSRMVFAASTNTGSDPDISEGLEYGSDKPYLTILSKLKEMSYDWKDVVFGMDRTSETFDSLIKQIYESVLCKPDHINRFFHLGSSQKTKK